MNLKYFIAACLALAPAAAFAEKITECVPMGLRDGAVQIYVLCNAQAVNTRWNLKIDPNSSCAVKGQAVARSSFPGQVLQQGSITRLVGDGYRPPLRECTDDEAIAFAQ